MLKPEVWQVDTIEFSLTLPLQPGPGCSYTDHQRALGGSLGEVRQPLMVIVITAANLEVVVALPGNSCLSQQLVCNAFDLYQSP